ncbi:MAG: methylenetetrahydrofolate--tRNA-(uracil(54)-C(5))-methyltransferase (FADH(2)-oxidizing) TrmFO [Proteobacteria bacterium]|jgi:tRNA:m(5)U-54 methyltransferase|nr:methylenetetrahydrofolate--tRNA-(uracil(54)-C(5))-methyltransferase (FADH(2)-oxidizing) TrmFO [Pseudomonadota bacterium]
MADEVHIIGAGLAGSEAAWQLAERGVKTVIHEMRPSKASPAHKTEYCAELVCSNSLRSDDYEHNAVGLMHEEMRRAGSLIMQCADATKVPAGGALAVDRDGFAETVTRKLKNHPLISFINEEITALPAAEDGSFIIASGPLTSEALIASILKEVNAQALNFYDAIAPVVYKESIDFDKAWYQSRYDKGDKFDYINCPLTQEEYYAFVNALLSAEKVEFHDFEKEASYFDGCLPIEIMAERGIETLVFGPMKPVGLTNPHNPEQKPYAVVQLRQDNKEDTLRNMVGFQTKLKYGEQQRIFRMIPGLENAEFARLGGIHRNTFIKSPILLDDFLRLKSRPNLRFAGQITGCEGYIESAAIGLLAGYFAACEAQQVQPVLPPETTALGAMLKHLRDDTNIDDFQPMNINFGIFPTIQGETTKNGKFRKIKGMERKEAYCRRALADIENWIAQI